MQASVDKVSFWKIQVCQPYFHTSMGQKNLLFLRNGYMSLLSCYQMMLKLREMKTHLGRKEASTPEKQNHLLCFCIFPVVVFVIWYFLVNSQLKFFKKNNKKTPEQ